MITNITVECQDRTVRHIRVEGNWSYSMALALAKDLEVDNFKSVSIGK